NGKTVRFARAHTRARSRSCAADDCADCMLFQRMGIIRITISASEMPLSELATHLLNVLHGIVACVATYAAFSSGGRGLLALSVQTLTKSSGRSVPSPAVLPGCPAILMLALYSLWCWYGIALGVSLAVLVWMFWGVLLLLSIAARSDIHSW